MVSSYKRSDIFKMITSLLVFSSFVLLGPFLLYLQLCTHSSDFLTSYSSSVDLDRRRVLCRLADIIMMGVSVMDSGRAETEKVLCSWESGAELM